LADVTYSDADSAKVYTHYSSTTWTSTNDCASSVDCDKTIPSATGRTGINAFTLTSELYTMSIKATFMTSWGETGVPVKGAFSSHWSPYDPVRAVHADP